MAPIDDTTPGDPNPYQLDDDELDDDPIEPAEIGDDEPAHDRLPEDPD
jgi:hypothetical protein